MEKKNQITSLFFIFITIYFCINTSTIYLTSIIMKDFQQSAWIIPLITIIPLCIFTFLYKPSNFKQEIENNILFKITMLITGIINTTIMISITSMMLGHAFFKISSTSLFLVLLVLVILFLSLGDLYKIIRLGLIFVVGSLIFIPFFLDLEPVNQPLLDIFPDKVNLSILKGLYFTSLINELFLFTIYNENYDKPISRKTILFCGLIILFTVSFHIIDSYTIVNYRYYQEIKILSFNRYFSHKGRRFFEHLDILLLYILLSTTLFKSSLYTIYSKTLFKNFEKYWFLLLYFLIILFLLFITYKNNNLIKSFIHVTNITSFIYLSLIIYYSRRKKDVKQNKR